MRPAAPSRTAPWLRQLPPGYPSTPPYPLSGRSAARKLNPCDVSASRHGRARPLIARLLARPSYRAAICFTAHPRQSFGRGCTAPRARVFGRPSAMRVVTATPRRVPVRDPGHQPRGDPPAQHARSARAEDPAVPPLVYAIAGTAASRHRRRSRSRPLHQVPARRGAASSTPSSPPRPSGRTRRPHDRVASPAACPARTPASGPGAGRPAPAPDRDPRRAGQDPPRGDATLGAAVGYPWPCHSEPSPAGPRPPAS